MAKAQITPLNIPQTKQLTISDFAQQTPSHGKCRGFPTPSALQYRSHI